MALRFSLNSTHYINCGSGTSLDDLGTWTIMFLYKRLAGSTTFRNIFGKDNGTTGHRLCYQGSAADELAVDVRRSGGTCSYETNNADILQDVWTYVGITFDIGASAGELTNIYRGTTGAMTECTYGVATDSSGTLGSDAAVDFRLGNVSGTNNQAMDLAFVMHWNRVLSLNEMLDIQFFGPRPSSGLVGLWIPGWNGTTNVPDWSGNGNTGTISGPALSNHAPLANPFQFWLPEESYVYSPPSDPPTWLLVAN